MAANALTPTGLTIQQLSDVINEILNGADGFPGLLQIYGPDLNVQPNSPDGNMVNIYGQGKIDVLELLLQIFTSFDPDQAVGVALNARCAINGIARMGPSNSTITVTVTATSGIIVLPGLLQNPNGGAFTVQDNLGNQWVLINTFLCSVGPNNLLFQAVNPGPVSSAPASITTIVTAQAGVTGVTNAAGNITTGQLEETDSALRIRRQNAVAIPGQSWFASLYAQLLATPGVTSCAIIENSTGGTVGGVPAHSIWVIVAAPNTAAMQQAIATCLYNGVSAGCGLYGGTTLDWPLQPDGAYFVATFDFATEVQIYFRATITAITGTVDEVYIAAQILAQFGSSYGINDPADATSIVAFIKSIAPNASVTNEAVSIDNATWLPIITPAAVNKQFYIPAVGNITLT